MTIQTANRHCPSLLVPTHLSPLSHCRAQAVTCHLSTTMACGPMNLKSSGWSIRWTTLGMMRFATLGRGGRYLTGNTWLVGLCPLTHNNTS